MLDDTTKPEADTRVTRICVYLYHTRDGLHSWGILPELWEDGMTVPDFLALTQEELEAVGAKRISFSGDNITKSARPGQLYAFKFDPGLNVATYTPKTHAPCAGLSPDTSLTARCLALQAEAEAYRANEKAVKGGTRSVSLSCLDPIRDAYQKLPAPARAHLLAMVVAHITTSGRKS